MKSIFVLLLAATLISIVSCQKEIEELPQPTRTTNAAGLPKLFKVTLYNLTTGAIDQFDYAKMSEDTVQHIISFVYDTIQNFYTKYFYDAGGRLIKKETRDSSIETTNFTRTGNQITWSTTWPGGSNSGMATVNTLASNKKQVDISEQSSYSGIPQYVRLILNGNDRVETSSDSIGVSFGQNYTGHDRYFYNSNGGLDSVLSVGLHTSSQDSNNRRYVFVRDNNNNQYWLKLIEKISGPDLYWAGQTSYVGLPIIFGLDNNLTDREFLTSGSVISSSNTVKYFIQSGSGIITQTYGPDVTTNTLTYDAEGRITKQVQKLNGALSRMLEITY